MNERERKICARLKSFREDIKWPLEAFAQEIGISHHKLAGIEYARTPLKYKVAIVICEVFDLSAEWIVTGKGERHGVQPFLWVVETSPDAYGNRLLSDVYESNPELFQLARHEDIYKPLANTPTPGIDPQVYLEKLIPYWFRGAKFRSPFDAERFAKKVQEFAESLLQQYLDAGRSSRIRTSKRGDPAQTGRGKDSLNLRQEQLDIVALANDNSAMQAVKSVAGIRQKLTRLTAKRGAKSALARKLGVSRQAVDQWLNGTTTPSTEIAIKVMNLE